MKKTTIINVIVIVGIISVIVAKQICSDEKGNDQRVFSEKRNFRDARIEQAIESGAITKQEGDELISLREKLREYREKIWEDKVMTNEERETLDKLSQEYREKMKKVFDAVMQKQEKKSLAEIFRIRIDMALKNNMINKVDADKLLSKCDEVETLEKNLWADNQLTQEEHEKLISARRGLEEEFRKIIMPKMEEKRKKLQQERQSNRDTMPPLDKRHRMKHFERERMRERPAEPPLE